MSKAVVQKTFDPALMRDAIGQSFVKLDPRSLWRNPVMFVTAAVAAVSTVLFVRDLFAGGDAALLGQISAWLWFTVLFANFAEALAEGRGKAQAESLRRGKTEAMARKIGSDGTITQVPATALRIGDVVLVEAGDPVPGDGDAIEGIASVDESAITGESAPVIRESGGDRSGVTGGTRVLAYPAAHFAVADGKADYGFIYLNVRMATGRSSATIKRAGDALLAGARAHFGTLFERKAVGMTLQIDESPGQAYDGKHSSLHPLFNKA